jgi:hypothetical protein
VAEFEPPPEDPPDEDEPPEVAPDEELGDPEALEELPLAPFEPPEPELDDVLEVEFDPLDEEDGEDSVVGAEDDSLPTVVGAGASSTTGAARVTSSAFAVCGRPWWRCWVACGVGAGVVVGAVLAGCGAGAVALVGAALAVCAAPFPPSDLAGATADSSWPKPSAAIGHWWKTWAETRTTKKAIAIPIRVTPDTAPAK